MGKSSTIPIINLSLALILCLLIFFQSAIPSPEVMPEFPYLDKILHFGAYALLAVLFFRAFEGLPIGLRPGTVATLGILASAIYGISDEIHQHFVPYRNADVWDWVADLLGSIFGVRAYLYLLKRYPISLRNGKS